MSKLRSRLTYANVTATLALVIAVAGGTAYAANTIGSEDIIDESILSKDIENGQVKTADIGNNQIRSADVRDDTLANGGLGTADIADDSLSGDDVLDDSLTGADVGDHTLTPDNLDTHVARPSGSTDVATVGSGYGDRVEYPLDDATWTQPAGEFEMVVSGTMTVTLPASCGGQYYDATVEAQITDDPGSSVNTFSQIRALSYPPGETVTQPFDLGSGGIRPIPSPEADAPHALTAMVWDNCSEPGEDAVVNSVDLDLIGLQ